MIIVPELETIVLRVPRTGSVSMMAAIHDRYPLAVSRWHHMEADGVPVELKHWRKVGVVRNPVERLWSWYKYCRQEALRGVDLFQDAKQIARLPFEQWIVEDDFVLKPFDPDCTSTPSLKCLHPAPETRKSAFATLRPDLGTEVWPFADIGRLANSLDVQIGRYNGTAPSPPPPIGAEATAHLSTHHAWDIEITGGNL